MDPTVQPWIGSGRVRSSARRLPGRLRIGRVELFATIGFQTLFIYMILMFFFFNLDVSSSGGEAVSRHARSAEAVNKSKKDNIKRLKKGSRNDGKKRKRIGGKKWKGMRRRPKINN